MAAGLHLTTAGTGPRLALLHGFTQTSASWAPLLPALTPSHEVVAVDLPGHGGSVQVDLDLSGAAAAVAQQVGRAAYVGYSMGGRVALRLALDHPDLVERLVLIGATAGIDDDEERRARRRADEDLAVAVETDGVEAFVDRWLAQPLFATLSVQQADRASRVANTASGLASSLRRCGTGCMDPPWWPELAALGRRSTPVTVVAGARDAKFMTLGRRLAESIGASATLVVVGEAGHACHLEQPERVAQVITGPTAVDPQAP